LNKFRIIGYYVLSAFFLLLASGRFLPGEDDTGDYVTRAAGIGIFLVSAALAVLFQRRLSREENRLGIYFICSLLILSVQLTGGPDGFVYPAYFLFLAWVSLPSVGRSATELGLVIGFVEAAALFSSTMWTGSEPTITKLEALLLPSLRALLSPFLFGLAVEWLSERDFPLSGTSRTEIRRTHAAPSLRGYSHEVLLDMFQAGCLSDTTFLFLAGENGAFTLAESSPGNGNAPPNIVLSGEHRLSRMATEGTDPVLIRLDSPGERRELFPVPPRTGGAGPSWVLFCPLKSTAGKGASGFLLQEFSGDRPSRESIKALERFAGILGRGNTGPGSDYGIAALFLRMVNVCLPGNFERAATEITGILAESIPGSTVSVARVDHVRGTTVILVSMGPTARRREGAAYAITEGVAGWIIRNGVSCRRTRLGHGPEAVGSFSGKGGHIQAGSIVGAPIKTGNAVSGLIMMEHPGGETFTREHEKIVEAAAGLLAIRMEMDEMTGRFENLSGMDGLTGLPGMTLFDEHLHEMAREVQTYGWYVGVVIADVDGFRDLNGKLGYRSCDTLLHNAAERFKGCFPDGVFIARTGPDSFGACIPRTNGGVMEALCQKVVDSLSFSFGEGNRGAGVTASVGGVYTYVNRKVLLLASEAEKAAEEAKATGRGSYVVKKLAGRGKT